MGISCFVRGLAARNGWKARTNIRNGDKRLPVMKTREERPFRLNKPVVTSDTRPMGARTILPRNHYLKSITPPPRSFKASHARACSWR
jgi:hypothetical protein